MTLATVVGVPAGTLVASLANWRATFLGVGALSAVAVVGVVAILPRLGGVEAVGFAERLAVARRPDALKLLTLTTLALIGPFAANTYLGVLAETTLGVGGVSLAGVLMIFGVLSLFGSQFGGYAADRWPRERFLAVIFVVLIVGFSALSAAPTLGGAAGATALFLGLALWGAFGWAFPIVQQARLISLDPKLASITLSLNTSALYIGAALGSLVGAFAVGHWSVAAIGWAAAFTELIALGWLVATAAPKPQPAAEAEPEIVACLATEE